MFNRHHNAGLEGDIAIELTEARLTRGIQQSVVAERLNVTRACVCQWEAGTTYPQSWYRWQEWARVVGKKLIIKVN